MSYPYPNQQQPYGGGGYPPPQHGYPQGGQQIAYVTQPGYAYDPNSSVQYVQHPGMQQGFAPGYGQPQVVYQQGPPQQRQDDSFCGKLCAGACCAALCCCCLECCKECC